MELFDVLPERFFGLLAGKCRRIYAEAGLCLYEQYRLAQFGIEQEILRDKRARWSRSLHRRACRMCCS